MKHYICGSGSFGCLYDYGPNVHRTKQAAIDDLVEVFVDSIPCAEVDRMRRNLKAEGTHVFSDPGSAGAQYASVSTGVGPMPECERGRDW